MLETFRTVLGTNHKKPKSRIWIEGERLKAAGFTVGTRYNRTVHRKPDATVNHIVLTLAADGKFKVSGKGEKPIIDITGSTVTELFTGTHVLVQVEIGIITIA